VVNITGMVVNIIGISGHDGSEYTAYLKFVAGEANAQKPGTTPIANFFSEHRRGQKKGPGL